MTMPGNGGAPITLREVYGLIESVRKELISEIKNSEAKMDVMLTKHDTEHMQHEERHEREHEKRVSLTRWAVTTVVLTVSVLVAIIALRAQLGG